MEPKTELEELRTSVIRIEAQVKAMHARLIGVSRQLEDLAEIFDGITEAMREAIAEEADAQAPGGESQADVLAEAISKLAATNDEEQKPKTAFPAWGAPIVEE